MAAKRASGIEKLSKAFRTAKPDRVGDPAHALLEAVEYPEESELCPLPEELTPEQREVAELLATRSGVPLSHVTIPQQAQFRRRWLGIDPPSVLEQRRSFVSGGKKVSWPVWRIWLQLQSEKRLGELAGVVPKPIDRLAAYADTWLWQSYGLKSIREIDALVDEVGAKGADWARGYLDTMASFPAPKERAAGNIRVAISGPSADPTVDPPDGKPSFTLLFAALLPIVRAGEPIEERWERFVPFVGHPRMLEVVEALTEERREDVLLAAMARELPGVAFDAACFLLPHYPLPRLMRAAESLLTGPLAKRPAKEVAGWKKRWKAVAAAPPAGGKKKTAAKKKAR